IPIISTELGAPRPIRLISTPTRSWISTAMPTPIGSKGPGAMCRARTRAAPAGRVPQPMNPPNNPEPVLAPPGRSADQWDIWQAVFGPVGADGYPAQIWDPLTGAIDHSVAQYWHDHYDLDA